MTVHCVCNELTLQRYVIVVNGHQNELAVHSFTGGFIFPVTSAEFSTHSAISRPSMN